MSIPYTHLAKGAFLITAPEVQDHLFSRSVLLLCEHGPAGSFALIVNKPIDADLPEEILNLKEIGQASIQVRAGGPNQAHQIMLVHTTDLSPQTLQICDGVFLGGDLTFLQEALNAESKGPILLCFGYTSWGPGQLEKEFLSGTFFLHPATSSHLFETRPQKLWQALLRDMGGKYASLSMIPEDLSLN